MGKKKKNKSLSERLTDMWNQSLAEDRAKQNAISRLIVDDIGYIPQIQSSTGSYKLTTTGGSVSINTSAGSAISSGSRLIYDASPPPPLNPTHNDKGVCQESYDQGYEDGVKAGLSGKDDRIK